MTIFIPIFVLAVCCWVMLTNQTLSNPAIIIWFVSFCGAGWWLLYFAGFSIGRLFV